MTLPSAFLSLLAHDTAGAGGFASGFQHPLTGLDHVVAMVAVGIWGAQLGRPAVVALPVAFPIVMALGAFLGLAGLGLPGVEVGIAASAVLLGLLVLLEAQLPWGAAAVVVAFFAVFHGHAHGTELPQGEDGLRYSIGFVLSTGLLHAAGITIGVLHRWPWGEATLRVLGGAVLATGGVFLWEALA